MRYLVIACAAVLVCGVIALEENKVDLAVFYDSMDPDSKIFFVYHLIPVLQDFWHTIHQLTFIPYGKTTREKIDGKWNFTCQQGEEECFGNKVHACILGDRSLKDILKLKLVLCIVRHKHPAKGLKACLAKYKKKSKLKRLTNCANGRQGDIILAQRGKDTDMIMKPLKDLPTVVINSKFDGTDTPNDLARLDLRMAVCNTAKPRPSGCPP